MNKVWNFSRIYLFADICKDVVVEALDLSLISDTLDSSRILIVLPKFWKLNLRLAHRFTLFGSETLPEKSVSSRFLKLTFTLGGYCWNSRLKTPS